jgi:hypothetical protein
VGDDVYIPQDSEGEDKSVHSADLSEETEVSLASEPSTADGTASTEEPEEDILAPLPEQQEELQAAAQVGDLQAAAELADLERLRKKGKLATYGAAEDSPPDSYMDEDELYDLADDEEQAVQQLLYLQAGESSKAAEEGESSHAAEKRSMAELPPPSIRQLVLEPPDDVSPEEELQRQLKLWPTVDQHIPVDQWHPCRLVFDERDHLILPPGPAHAMYGFLTRARYEVRQYDLNHPEVQPCITKPAPGQGGPRGQRPTLDFQRLNQSFHQWDPRIQNLLSQVRTTVEGKALSKRKQQWREVIKFRKLEVSLAQLHARAATIGIVQGHRQRPASSNFEWPDPVPARIRGSLPALGEPPAKRMRVESPGPEEGEEELAADQPAASPSGEQAGLLVEEITADPQSDTMQPAALADPAAMQVVVYNAAQARLAAPRDPLTQATHELHELRGRYQRLSDMYTQGKEQFRMLAEERAARDLSHNLLVEIHREIEADLEQMSNQYRELHTAYISLNNRYQAHRERRRQRHEQRHLHRSEPPQLQSPYIDLDSD